MQKCPFFSSETNFYDTLSCSASFVLDRLLIPLQYGLACHHGVKNSPNSNLMWPQAECVPYITL